MPSRPAESLLFHKKKSIIKKEPSATPPSGSQGTPTPGSPRKSLPPRPQSSPADIDVDDSTKLPEGEYSEYKLMSSALNGWKYDVMRFDSRKLVDISTWEAPIKLNRKDLRKADTISAQVPVRPMLGPDGKPVIGSDGKIVMVDTDGRLISNNTGEASPKDKEPKGKGAANGKKKLQRKTRQVFKVPEDVRQLRKEERYPWVMEDARHDEVWVGQLEEVSRAETHALFMPALQDVFKFVPAHRWYKFHKKPKHRIPDLEEAESLMAKIQKNKDPERWLLHRKNGQRPSAATTAMFKAEPDSGSSTPLVYDATQSRGPGGRSLVSVNRGPRGLNEEEGEGSSRPKKDDDGEGHLDEQLFEDDVADDDEHEAADMDDEEAKELEERLKREYRMANKQREGYIDESEDEEGDSQLTKDGKSLKKLMRKLEKNVAYDSDEERNPYASSDENEEEEEPLVASNEPAIQQQQQAKSRLSSQQPSSKSAQPSVGNTANGSSTTSRAVSPAPTLGMGGHSVVAKRATSPKAPKPSVSRGNSPLSGPPGTSSKAGSPAGSRATSPVATATKGASGTPPTNKRKATDDLSGAVSPTAASNGTAPPKPKKRKPLPPGPIDGELEERMLIEWLQSTPNATTRDCIQHFTPYLTSEAKKTRFTAMVKEVAQLKGGILILKSALRGESATGSPAPVAAT
ncbi:hypothetical protein V8B97DRAFT_2001968 [Scleroderma yunnanense]